MNFEAIKIIYYNVLKSGKWKVKYYGGDRFSLIAYHNNGNKHRKIDFNNELRNGEDTIWDKNGRIFWSDKYENGIKIR